jgi:hypothetical protein
MRARPILLLVGLLAAAPMLTACTDFDPDKLDFFHLNEKKKLPGERKELFPQGVPGVAQGIPPDLIKGHQPPPEAETTKVAEPEPPKPKPKVARRPAPKPSRVTVQPASAPPAQPTQPTPEAQQPAQQAQQQQPAWPDPKPQATGANAPWPAPAKQSSPWPDAPPPNTFQR